MKKTILLFIFVFSLFFQAFLAPEVGATEVILEATYSTDVKKRGTKYYHDGNDWVGRRQFWYSQDSKSVGHIEH